MYASLHMFLLKRNEIRCVILKEIQTMLEDKSYIVEWKEKVENLRSKQFSNTSYSRVGSYPFVRRCIYKCAYFLSAIPTHSSSHGTCHVDVENNVDGNSYSRKVVVSLFVQYEERKGWRVYAFPRTQLFVERFSI